MLSGTNILAHRARVGFIKLNKAAKYIIVSPGRPYCSTPGAVVAAAAAVAPAAAANLSAIQPPQLELSFAERLGVHASDGRIQLKNLTFEELEEWCQSMGHDSRKALLLWKAMYQDGRWMRDIAEDDAQLDASTPAAAAAAAGGVLRGSAGLQLSAALKATVQQHASLDGGLTLQSVTTARDGTHKLIFALHGGPTNGSVETVLIPMRDRGGTRLRYTACLSSQVGCAMNCQFCYTGRMGLLGNLTTAQIVEQLVEARRWLAHYTAQQQQQEQQEQQELQQQPQLHSQQQQQQQDGASGVVQQAGVQQEDPTTSSRCRRARGKGSSWPTQPPRINNIVFMGMGEPLHCPSMWPALDILCHPQGLALSRSKVIVSTVGLLPQLRELRASGKAKLAVSLHATTDEVRDWIVPTNRRYPLAELISTLRELYPLPAKATSPSSHPSAADAGTNSSSAASSSSESASSSSKKRGSQSDDFVVIEYVLLKDVNDTDADAHRLLELLSEVYCMINLIVFNPHEGTAFQRSDEQQARRFREIVQGGGKVCTLRISKGDDEMAACGQLGGASMNLATRPAPLLQPPEKLRESLPGAAAAVSALRQQRHVAGTGAARHLLLKRQRQLMPAVVPRV